MDNLSQTQPLSLRDTAKGMAVRAGILSVGAIVVGTFLFSLAAKAASGLVKLVAGVLLLAIGGGYAAWEVKKMQRRLASRGTPTV
jgi:hypothetical protein